MNQEHPTLVLLATRQTSKMKDMELLKKSQKVMKTTFEVDVVEGESRVAKRGTLKREANSLHHKLTHRYKRLTDTRIHTVIHAFAQR